MKERREEGREKREGELLFIGQNGGSATFDLILFAKQDKEKRKIDSNRLVSRDKHSHPTAVSWIRK